MTDVAKNCVYVALGAVVLCCPECVIPKETWTLAQGASQILVKQSPK